MKDSGSTRPSRRSLTSGHSGPLHLNSNIEASNGFGMNAGSQQHRGSTTSDFTLVDNVLLPVRPCHTLPAASPHSPPPYTQSPVAETSTAGFVASHRDAQVEVVPPLTDVPRMNIVIFIVGSRGDVQPFLALALTLIMNHGHRVRIATHSNYREFVLSENARLREIISGPNGQNLEGKLEFFDAGGDPKDLMQYMVKNPGLFPGVLSLVNGDIGRKQKMAAIMLDGFYRSTHSPDPVTGRPFAADAVISNPPTFAHFHVCEALGIPLHMSFTMPWTASTSFPHPLMNSNRKGVDKSVGNYLGFGLANNLMWQGLGSQINHFRKRQLLLNRIHQRMAPSVLDKLKVPWTYCWSPNLLPKPDDWRSNIDVSGFYFLDNDIAYTPPAELVDFLATGPRPIYIGFGSIPIPKPDQMTDLLFKAIHDAGVRAIISSGWAGLGQKHQIPDHILLLTADIPHEWLFAYGRVAGVVHHGGAGTTACGLRYGRPTAIIPFFGDQKFWGDAVFGAGAGPKPIPYKQLKAPHLTAAILTLFQSNVIAAAESIGESIRCEKGEAKGADSFHRHLPMDHLRCDIDDTKVATLYCRKFEMRLSTEAAGVFLRAHLLEEKDLIAYRSIEYDTTRHNFDPIRGLLFGFNNAWATALTGATQLLYKPHIGVKNLTWGVARDSLAMIADLHEGFDNLPHLIGSSSRKRGKITGVGSGLVEGGKTLCLGIYDGVVGLVTDPIDGALREGPLGFVKGCGRGALNLVFRPMAGSLGFIALPGEGVVRASRKLVSRAKDPRVILFEPRIWSAKISEVNEATRQKMTDRFDEIKRKDLVRHRRKRRRQIKWVLIKNQREREEEWGTKKGI